MTKQYAELQQFPAVTLVPEEVEAIEKDKRNLEYHRNLLNSTFKEIIENKKINNNQELLSSKRVQELERLKNKLDKYIEDLTKKDEIDRLKRIDHDKEKSRALKFLNDVREIDNDTLNQFRDNAKKHNLL